MESERKQKFIQCNCFSEGILITKEEDNQVWFAIFSYGQHISKPSFIQRLKYCWFHLKTGKIYEDEIILSDDNAKELGEFLIN